MSSSQKYAALSFKQIQVECEALERLLTKNKSQHRRGKYYKQLWMLSKAFKRIIKQFTIVHPGISDALVGETLNENPIKRRIRVLALCASMEGSGSLMIKCAGQLTALIARTHFIAFATAILVILSRSKILLMQLLHESINLYNGISGNLKGAKDLNLPFILEYTCNKVGFPFITCHYDYPAETPDTSSGPEEDIGKPMLDESKHDIDSDPETIEALLPVVNDTIYELEHRHKKPKHEPKPQVVKDLTQPQIKESVHCRTETNAEDLDEKKEDIISSSGITKDKSKVPQAAFLQEPKSSEAFIRVTEPVQGNSGVKRKKKSYQTSFMLRNSQADIDSIFDLLDKPTKNK